MFIQRNLFNQLIKKFNFAELFIELGWDRTNITQKVKANERTYEISAAAEKRGFVIFVCNSNEDNRIPNKDERKKIDKAITKLYYEHLIIYVDKNKTQQLWQLSIQEPNKPIQYREFIYYSTNEPEQLFEKLHHLFFTLDDEDKIGLVDVKIKVSEQFNKNAEKVTKKFYTEFKKHHNAFQSFIEGLENQMEIDWYTSLMLNRLMFIYFIQKKGFLDSNTNYLSDKLRATKNKQGRDKFYKSFYKTFLLTLFHQGLGKPNHTPDFENELGKIPYLNGGLFDVHKLEKDNDKLDIADEAFEKLFDFFDQYNWHLDIKPNTTGKDINPDVIGYIFEKYINDRAAKGAYYTKEDITEYISKNTIIPFLFDRVKEKVKNAFANESSLWQMLKENPDRYIYDAVRKGINGNLDKELTLNEKVGDELPDYITVGIDTTKPNLLERRKRWNEKTAEEFALPTEIWRETIERRKRYWELRDKIENDEIREINDFITYNLNIRQFAQDAVEQYEGSDFINAFYKAITELTILDPTCGSGAFLFAALNILEPLYEACIGRMREFVEIDDEKGTGRKHENFRKVLADIENHTNEKYYIYKSIILNNLYGVDIMNEAVEIAKLRLFLKLVAVVEPDDTDENYGLEPLPDIDFNIRSGNTLVGFTSFNEIKNAFEETEANGKLLFGEERKVLQKIDDQANIVADLFREFKKQQTINNPNSIEYKETKEQVNKKRGELNDLLNKYLAFEYGINADDLVDQGKYREWLTSHKPFHWFTEFYEIVHQNGGFDVVIGNPPYVEYSSIKKSYTLRNYKTIASGNLYSFIIERSINIQNNSSYNGMIIPLSAYCTDRMNVLQSYEFSKSNSIWLSNYAERPSKLFTGAERNLTIAILDIGVPKYKQQLFTTYYYKWNAEFRDNLFQNISYCNANGTETYGIIPKVSGLKEVNILKNFREIKKTVNSFLSPRKSENILYYRNSGGRYWKIITDFQPKFFLDGIRGVSSRESYLYFSTVSEKNIVVAILNSSLFYWYYVMHSDARTNNPSDLKDFPIDITSLNSNIRNSFNNLSKSLMDDLKENSELIFANLRTGEAKFQQFYPVKSKPIIDEIDKVLAQHYGFTEEELDFIINYDIKYRMGKELNK